MKKVGRKKLKIVEFFEKKNEKKLGKKVKTLPEAQRTQGIESET